MFAPVLDSFKNRWAWLAVNLVTAFIASRVIGVFEDSIAQLVALAALMPIVAGIGGNSGNQTITMIVRALALGQIQGRYWAKLLGKEIGVALLNGAVWGTLLGAIAYLFYGNVALGGVMALAMMLNLLLAALHGRGHPLAARALRPRPGGRLLGADHRRAPTPAASSSSSAWPRCSLFERVVEERDALREHLAEVARGVGRRQLEPRVGLAMLHARSPFPACVRGASSPRSRSGNA